MVCGDQAFVHPVFVKISKTIYIIVDTRTIHRAKRVEQTFFCDISRGIALFAMSSTGQAENKINRIKLTSGYIYFM